MQYKYSQFICSIDQCPPKEALPVDRKGFRIVAREREANQNFIPVGILDPSRSGPKFQKNVKFRCSLYALSFFDTSEQALKKLRELLKFNKKIRNKLGESIACVGLTQNDGKAIEPSQSGHFDFHEFENCELGHRQEIVEVLD